MSDTSSLIEPADSVDAEEAPAARKRPKPGERRVQILQALAAMLEQPGAERITTAALAARLSVSEAALYRHFASKAQMFEGLIDFIEQSVFTLVQQITGRDVPAPDQPAEVGLRQASRIIALLLQFGERNPGMVRVMVGDALVFEHERLQQRMNQFFDRIESTLRLFASFDGFLNLPEEKRRPLPHVPAKPQRDSRSGLASLRTLQRRKYGKKV